MGQDPSGRGRRLLRLGLLLLAAYGPLAPAVLVLLLVGAALWLGPRALAEVRAFLDEERRRN
jgi:hypothetical protein